MRTPGCIGKMGKVMLSDSLTRRLLGLGHALRYPGTCTFIRINHGVIKKWLLKLRVVSQQPTIDNIFPLLLGKNGI